MLETFVPDMYQKNIYYINYEKLMKNGIKLLIFDLDNTLAPPNINKPEKKVKKLIDELKDMGFKIIIMSNTPKARVEPFKNELLVDSAPFAMKPKKEKYERIIEKYGYKPTEIAAIGDQLITDIKGANRMGITSILVNPLTDHDFVTVFINRVVEKIIINKLTKKELFKKGEYYE